MQIKLKTGSIRLRKDGRYELRYYQNKKRYCVYGKTDKDAIQKYNNNINKPIKQENITLNKWLEQWLTLYKKDCAAKTIINKRNQIDKYVINSIGAQNIKTVTTEQIQILINKIAEKHTRTAQMLFNTLNECLNQAKNLHIIKDNPCIFVNKIKHIGADKKPIAAADLKKILLTTKNTDFNTLIKFYLYTGARPNEAITIKQRFIDHKNNVLFINGTKTKTSPRFIPLFAPLKLLLQKMQIKQPDDFIFNYKLRYIQKQFSELCKSLKIDGNGYTLNSLRHTFATYLYEDGIPDKVIQKILGHTTVKTTDKNYIHISNDFTNSFIEKINGILTPKFDP